MRFEITHNNKKIIFDEDQDGLRINDVNYIAGQNGELIYDQTEGIVSDEVVVQMSTNTSALVPCLRTLGLRYHPYFDDREVVDSQNDITFYWKKSKLAAFYNLYSTDGMEYKDRDVIIKSAIGFLLKNTGELPLVDEFLKELEKPVELLGFYNGFPIYNGDTGLPKLQSRLGIHIGSESVMISTPMNKYSDDVYELAQEISRQTSETYSAKKNRVVFKKTENLMRILDDNRKGFS